MKNRFLLALVMVAMAASAGAAFYEIHHRPQPVQFETAFVSRGAISSTVGCSGTVQAAETVQVGTQENGVIRELRADFNSVVHRGEVLARLDSASIQAQLEQARANVERQKSAVEGLEVARDEALRNLARVQALFARQLATDSDLEDARVAAESAAADVKAAEKDVEQAQASVDSALLDLQRTVITSPIDGIVVARDVDVGQTVVSNMQAQVLFEVANDLGHVQVAATVDESDIGRVRKGDPVTLTVEAYPDRPYAGTVSQVRAGPTIDQNVVSYVTIIEVANPDLTLRPGMTASVTIRTDARQDALRVPTVALHFRPYDELFAKLGQPRPAVAMGTLPQTAAGHLWMLKNGRLQPIDVQVGLSDGTFSEIVTHRLQAGDRVVINVRPS